MFKSIINARVLKYDTLHFFVFTYKEIQKERIRELGKAYNDMNMVIAREDGWFMDSSTFRDKYYKLLENLNLKKCKFHALRHTFATRALEANVQVKTVSKILGHAGVQITMDTYSHVLPELQEEAMDKIVEYVMI